MKMYHGEKKYIFSEYESKPHAPYSEDLFLQHQEKKLHFRNETTQIFYSFSF